MSYAVKEIFRTLQGEGANAGRAAVFCRFSGCNLWSGREEDRAKAQCQFCDTDFVGIDGTKGGRYPDARSLAEAIAEEWGPEVHYRFAVLTGGEPCLQVDDALCEALHVRGFTIAIETNGTLDVPHGIDWICVSPKSGAPLRITSGHELKLVFPQSGAQPEQYENLAFENFSLQPMYGAELVRNTELTVDYCLKHPRWRMSTQTHKVIGIR